MSRSLDEVNDEEWLMTLGNALGERDVMVDRYSNFPEEKVL